MLHSKGFEMSGGLTFKFVSSNESQGVYKQAFSSTAPLASDLWM